MIYFVTYWFFLNKNIDNDTYSNSDKVSLPTPMFTASFILPSFFSSIYTQCLSGVSPLSFPFSRMQKSYAPLLSFYTFLNSILSNIYDITTRVLISWSSLDILLSRFFLPHAQLTDLFFQFLHINPEILVACL